MKIDHTVVSSKARELVLSLAKETGLDGSEKREKAIDDIAKFIDDNTRTGIVDPFDRPVIKLVVGGVVQAAYNWAKADGSLANAEAQAA